MGNDGVESWIHSSETNLFPRGLWRCTPLDHVLRKNSSKVPMLPDLASVLLSTAKDVGVKCTAPFAYIGVQGCPHLKQT